MPSTRTLPVLVVFSLVLLGVGVTTASGTALCLAPDCHSSLADDTADTNQSAPVSVTVERAPGHLPPSEALGAASQNATIRPDDWLVLTVDIGSVVDTVDESTVLADENGTAGVTLSMVQTNPPPSLQRHEIAVANLTRQVDAANGTITYFYDGQSPTLRVDDPNYRVNLTVSESNDHVSRGWTVDTNVRISSPMVDLGGEYLGDDPRSREILPNRSNVTIPLTSRFSPEKPLTVSLVGANGTTVAPARTVTVTDTGAARTTVALSVANGTAATVVVADGHTGRTILTKGVVIGEIADPEICRISQEQLLPPNASGSVTVAVENEGSAAFDGPVTATVGDTTHSQSVRIPPAGRTNVTFAVETHSPGSMDFTAAVGANEDYQHLAVGGPTIGFVEVANGSTGEVVVRPQRDRPLALTAALTNPSVWSTRTTVRATLANQTVRQQVTVRSGTTNQTTLSVPVASLSPGTYDLTVQTNNDTVTRTLVVQSEQSTPTDSTTTTTSTPGVDGSGFGIVAAVLALVSVAWFRR